MLRIPQQRNSQAMGQIDSAHAVPFILGAVTWAVFGTTISSLFGLGNAVASRGIEAAHSRVAPRKRLPPPSGSK